MNSQRSHEKPLTVNQAADYINVSERYMRRLVQERRITFIKVGRLLRFSPEVLDAFLDENVIEAVR